MKGDSLSIEKVNEIVKVMLTPAIYYRVLVGTLIKRMRNIDTLVEGSSAYDEEAKKTSSIEDNLIKLCDSIEKAEESISSFLVEGLTESNSNELRNLFESLANNRLELNALLKEGNDTCDRIIQKIEDFLMESASAKDEFLSIDDVRVN